MPATTAHGWPYILPEDHPLEFPTHSQELATLLDARVGAPAYKIKGLTLTGLSSDGAGIVAVNAATIGLTTIVGAVANINWGAVWNGATPHFCDCRLNGSTLVQILILGLTATPPATVTRVANATGITIYLTAWGT